jgi:hypothetical protein
MVDTVDLEGKMSAIDFVRPLVLEETHPDSSSLKFMSSFDGTVDVLSKDGGCKSVNYRNKKQLLSETDNEFFWDHTSIVGLSDHIWKLMSLPVP